MPGSSFSVSLNLSRIFCTVFAYDTTDTNPQHILWHSECDYWGTENSWSATEDVQQWFLSKLLPVTFLDVSSCSTCSWKLEIQQTWRRGTTKRRVHRTCSFGLSRALCKRFYTWFPFFSKILWHWQKTSWKVPITERDYFDDSLRDDSRLYVWGEKISEPSSFMVFSALRTWKFYKVSLPIFYFCNSSTFKHFTNELQWLPTASEGLLKVVENLPEAKKLPETWVIVKKIEFSHKICLGSPRSFEYWAYWWPPIKKLLLQRQVYIRKKFAKKH